MLPPDGLIDEFANTFQEVHYLAGGFCVGFVLGWLAAADHHHIPDHDQTDE